MKKPIMNEKTYKYITAIQSVAVLVAFAVIMLSMFSVSVVPSLSMAPTLEKGSILFGSRNVDNLEYDDIVQFFPNDSVVEGCPLLCAITMRVRNSELYCKRCVGLPGDTIAVHNGYLYRNGEKIVSSYTKDELIGYEMEEITLLDNEYFMLGDNRNNSRDSHIFGPVLKNQILSKVLGYF